MDNGSILQKYKEFSSQQEGIFYYFQGIEKKLNESWVKLENERKTVNEQRMKNEVLLNDIKKRLYIIKLG